MSLLEECASFFLQTFLLYIFLMLFEKYTFMDLQWRKVESTETELFFTCTEWLKTNKPGININISYMYCTVI